MGTSDNVLGELDVNLNARIEYSHMRADGCRMRNTWALSGAIRSVF